MTSKGRPQLAMVSSEPTPISGGETHGAFSRASLAWWRAIEGPEIARPERLGEVLVVVECLGGGGGRASCRASSGKRSAAM